VGQGKDVNGLPKQPVLYEAMYILDSALEESAAEGIVAMVEELVSTNGGEVVASREFGKRRLAFEIDGHTSGTYMITYFNSFGNVVEELVHEMRLTEGIVRGIVVVANPKAIFDPQPVVEAVPEESAAAGEPEMALGEATGEEAAEGEAVAEAEGVAEPEVVEEVVAEAPVVEEVVEEAPVVEEVVEEAPVVEEVVEEAPAAEEAVEEAPAAEAAEGDAAPAEEA
jgi:ribosomal protein S6